MHNNKIYLAKKIILIKVTWRNFQLKNDFWPIIISDVENLGGGGGSCII